MGRVKMFSCVVKLVQSSHLGMESRSRLACGQVCGGRSCLVGRPTCSLCVTSFPGQLVLDCARVRTVIWACVNPLFPVLGWGGGTITSFPSSCCCDFPAMINLYEIPNQITCSPLSWFSLSILSQLHKESKTCGYSNWWRRWDRISIANSLLFIPALVPQICFPLSHIWWH